MMEYYEMWDELKHVINCDINFHQKRIDDLSKEAINDINHDMAVFAREPIRKLTSHWNCIEELKSIQAQMREIEEMEEED